MSVERYISSKNNAQIQRLINFYASLIIKNEIEAQATETTLSESNFIDYQSAVQSSDSFINYNTPSYNEFIQAGFNNNDAITYSQDINSLNILLYKNDGRALNLISFLRSQRISSYVEMNPYYLVFLGTPVDPTQYVYVTNEDTTGIDPSAMVRIDSVNAVEYPNTYDRLFVKMAISQIIEEYPNFIYLKFLASPMSIIYLRNTPQFSILYYDETILINDEIDYFYESYESCRIKMLTVDWIEGYESRFTEYSYTMLLLLLYESFLYFVNKYLVAFSQRSYTDNDIYEILDSNGLSNLKSLDMSLLRNVIEHLPAIMAVRGTDSVINTILNVVNITDVQIKRYRLSKFFSPNMEFVTNIDQSSGYAQQVDLKFVETIEGGNPNVASTVYDYTTFVADDNLWGGRSDSSNIVIAQAQENMRQKLLGMKFNSIKTKYLVVARQVQIIEMTAMVSNYLGLVFQYNQNYTNILVTSGVNYNGLQVQPISLWAAICWGTSIINNLPNPSTIRKDAFELSDVMILRKTMGISGLAQSILASDVTIGNITASVKLGTLINFDSGDSLINYLISFNLTPTSTLEDLFSQYGTNKAILDTVEQKISNSNTMEEYVFWKTIQSYNTISEYISNLFNGLTAYDDYIKQNSEDFYNNIKVIFDYDLTDSNNYNIFSTTLANIIAAFSGFIQAQSGGEAIIPSQSEISSGGDTSLQSIQLLLTEFVSLYTQLYKVEYDELMNDPLENTIHPLYSLFAEINNLQDEINLIPTEVRKSDVMNYLMEDNISYIENIFQSFSSYFSDIIINQDDTSRFKLISDQKNDDIIDDIYINHVKNDNYSELRQDTINAFDNSVWT